MDSTPFSLKTSRRKISAEQLAAAVAACPPELIPSTGLLPLPPSCNTGVDTTKGPVQGSKEALVDYVRFVVKEPQHLDWYLSFFGGDVDNWQVKERGFYGYRRSHWLSNIAIFSDGGGDNGEDMGFCVQLSGQGCREFESTFPDMTKNTPFAWDWRFFLKKLSVWAQGEGGFPGTKNVTRLDVALDDRSGGLDIGLVKESTIAGEFSCRGGKAFRYGCESKSDEKVPVLVHESQPRGADRLGVTVEFGRKSSTQMVRIYDKAAQMAAKGGEVVGDWIRTEYQANGERAHMLAQQIGLAGMTCVPAIIHGYLDFKVPNNEEKKNRYRAETAPWWQAFLESWEKLSITLRAHVQTVEGLRRWIEQQAAPTLAVLNAVSRTGPEWFRDVVRDGTERLKPKHFRIIKAECLRLEAFAPGVPTPI